MLTKSPKSGDLKFPAPPCASGWMILHHGVSRRWLGDVRIEQASVLVGQAKGAHGDHPGSALGIADTTGERACSSEDRGLQVGSSATCWAQIAAPVWWPWPQSA